MKAKTLITIIISALVVGAAIGVVHNFFDVNPAISGVLTTAIVVPMSIGIVRVANKNDEGRK